MAAKLAFQYDREADILHISSRPPYAEQESEETSDESIAGASYTAFMFDPWGWYVRGEVERDEFEDIDLRTTLAAGLSYRPINTDERMLKFFLGLGYRHESFATRLPVPVMMMASAWPLSQPPRLTISWMTLAILGVRCAVSAAPTVGQPVGAQLTNSVVRGREEMLLAAVVKVSALSAASHAWKKSIGIGSDESNFGAVCLPAVA